MKTKTILHTRKILANVRSSMSPKQFDEVCKIEWDSARKMGYRQAEKQGLLKYEDCGCCNNLSVGPWEKQDNGDFVCEVYCYVEEDEYE